MADLRWKGNDVAQRIAVHFEHGLGDCSNFAHLIPLWTRRGYEVAVSCTPDKRPLFEAAGALIIDRADGWHPWNNPDGRGRLDAGEMWAGNKVATNLDHPVMPPLGSTADLWPELLAVRLRLRVPQESRDRVADWLDPLPRPIVLLHTVGNTSQHSKSLPADIAEQLYLRLIDETDASIVLLDWDSRVPRFAHGRMRHLSDDFGQASVTDLAALCDQAELLVGVDSGPLHFARFTDVKALGIWCPGHYPSSYALPRAQTLNLVLHEVSKQWTRYTRIPYNVVEQRAGVRFDPAVIARYVGEMLGAPRYLEPAKLAADIVLRQFVHDYCRGGPYRGHQNFGFGKTFYADRNRSFDALLREVVARFAAPRIVETGCIRMDDDFPGAGFSTYVLGDFVYHHGGSLDSVDCNPDHVGFALARTRVFGSAVRVHTAYSWDWFAQQAEPIDVLYQDSIDTEVPTHAADALRELQSAYGLLHDRSLILYDDTPRSGGEWLGKGKLCIPWLLERGWRILYAGYQVLLARTA